MNKIITKIAQVGFDKKLGDVLEAYKDEVINSLEAQKIVSISRSNIEEYIFTHDSELEAYMNKKMFFKASDFNDEKHWLQKNGHAPDRFTFVYFAELPFETEIERKYWVKECGTGCIVDAYADKIRDAHLVNSPSQYRIDCNYTIRLVASAADVLEVNKLVLMVSFTFTWIGD